MKIAVFWDVMPYNLLEGYQYFKWAYCLHLW